MNARDVSFEALQIGETATFSRTIHEKDVEAFALLSGDMNPLHMDEAYAQTTQFGQRIVHGMFLGALCSCLVGMYLPGKRCLYLSQTLIFKKPVFIGDTVDVEGTLISKSQSTKLLSVDIVFIRDKEVVAQGQAQVQVLG